MAADDQEQPPKRKLQLRKAPDSQAETVGPGKPKDTRTGPMRRMPVRSHTPTVSSEDVPQGGAKPKVIVTETGEIETANLRKSVSAPKPSIAKPRLSVGGSTEDTAQIRPKISMKQAATTADEPLPVTDTTRRLRPRQAPSTPMTNTDSTASLRRQSVGGKETRDTSKSLRRRVASTPPISDTTMAIHVARENDMPTEDSEAAPSPIQEVSDGTVTLRKKDRDSSKRIRRRRRAPSSQEAETPTVGSETAVPPGVRGGEETTVDSGVTMPADTTKGLRRRPVSSQEPSGDTTRGIRPTRRPGTQIAAPARSTEFPTEDSESAPPPGATEAEPVVAPRQPLPGSADETAQIRTRVRPAPSRAGGAGPQSPGARPTDTSSAIRRRAVGTETTGGMRARSADATGTSNLRAKPIVPGRPATAPGAAQSARGQRDQATARLKRVPRPGTTVPGIADPMASRNTGPVSQIKPGDERRPAPTEDTLDTETVHLRVIKEKKKQLAGILSASQTIRLRPSPGPQTVSQTGTVQQPPPAAPQGEAAGRRTLKVKGPATGDAATSRINRPTQPGAAPPSATAKSKKRPTLKIKSTGPTSDTPTADSEAIPPPSRPATSEGAESQATATKAGKSTLKVRAPESQSDDSRGKARSTLKIKAPTREPAAAPSEEPQEDAQRTTKREAPKRKEKTLRLKQPAGGKKAKDEKEQASAVETQGDALADSDQVAPGALYTIGSVAALALAGLAAYFTVMPYTQLFQ